LAMRWLEMIRLRTTQDKVEGLNNFLFESLRQIGTENGLVEARVLANITFQGDLAMNILWNTPLADHRGSRAGLGIAQALRTFGLVEHSIWMENGAHSECAPVARA